MARILCYTSPSRGHLYPTVPVLLELARRGHDIRLVALASEVERMTAMGLCARPISPSIEAVEMSDWRATSPTDALARAVATFTARAEPEIADLEAALETDKPELVLVDYNCWGAAAMAERSTLPWALFMPYFLPWRLPGLPPFGPGLLPRRGPLGRARDALMRRVVHGVVNRHLPKLNSVRARVGLPALTDMTDQGRSAPCVLYYTAEPFEYSCAERPPQVKLIGPGLWEPPQDEPSWLSQIDLPIVLATCSTEYQNDGRIISAARDAFAQDQVFLIATSAAIDPASFGSSPNMRVERFLPHGRILRRASCVICHAGMGITQKALAAGVPVCVVPFGRDQNEVAAHVRASGAGVSLRPSRLRPDRLRAAVEQARARKDGAERVAAGFRSAGGVRAGADALEALLR
jgi:MGT family glycosyltransferase